MGRATGDWLVVVVTSFAVGGGGGVDWALLLEPASSEPTEYIYKECNIVGPSIPATSIGNGGFGHYRGPDSRD